MRRLRHSRSRLCLYMKVRHSKTGIWPLECDTQLRPLLLMKECRVELELQQRKRLKSGLITERESYEVNRTEQYPDGKLCVVTGCNLGTPLLDLCLLSRTRQVSIDHICTNTGVFSRFMGRRSGGLAILPCKRMTHWISRRFALVRENSPRM